MKNLIKYLCCGAATAGITAPVTYLTTREDFTKDKTYLKILDEIEEQKEKKEALGEEMKEKETKIGKLKSCLDSAQILEHYGRDSRGAIIKGETV